MRRDWGLMFSVGRWQASGFSSFDDFIESFLFFVLVVVGLVDVQRNVRRSVLVVVEELVLLHVDGLGRDGNVVGHNLFHVVNHDLVRVGDVVIGHLDLKEKRKIF